MTYLVGIDIGTSATKTDLYLESGEVVATASSSYRLYQPHNGWAEQIPEDWWEATVETIEAVIAQSGVNPQDIKGLGLSGQMHGLVMLDEDNNVIRPAIIWADQRTEEQVAWLENNVGRTEIIKMTANPPVTGFTLAKLLWVRQHEPELFEKCRMVLLPKDYIRFRLSGVFATEVSDASGTQLLDVDKRNWSSEMLELLDLDQKILPAVHESIEITSEVSGTAASLTGLKEGTPIVGGAGDNAAAAIGTGVIEAGKAFTTIGTSGVVFAHTDFMRFDPEGRIHTMCAAVPNAWHVMGVTQAAGLSLSWFRDNFCQDLLQLAEKQNKNTYAIMDEIASKVEAGSDRLIYLPYLMGERTPWLDPNARGVFFGLSARHKREHLIRAIMEGVSFSQLDTVNIMRELGLPVSDMRATGGGASPFWRQMLADVYGVPVHKLAANTGGTLGVALLAAVATGSYKDLDEACAVAVKPVASSKPDRAVHDRYQQIYPLYHQLYLSLKEDFISLAEL